MRAVGLLAFLGCLWFGLGAHGGSFRYDDFRTTAGLQLNGVARVLPDYSLELVPGQAFRRGSVYTTSTYSVSSFTAEFRFQILDGAADGLAFVIQRVGPGALGRNGGDLAYGGVANSVAVEFDIWWNFWDPSGDHVGIDVNGSLSSVATATLAGGRQFTSSLRRPITWSVRIDYDGDWLRVRASDPTGYAVTLAHRIDIPAVIGGSHAYLGFSAATGAAVASHRILSWSFRSGVAGPTPIPEPASLVLLLVGGAATLRNRLCRV